MELQSDPLVPSGVPAFRPEMAFPTLTLGMVERIRRYATELTSQPDQELFAPGQRRADMFVVLEGGVEIVASGGDKQLEHIRLLGPLEFTGELDLLNSQRALVWARAVGESRLLRVLRKDLAQLMRAEGDIANLIMQATIWRRLGIIANGTGGVTLCGPREDAETILLHRFLIRNSYPYRLTECPPTSTEQERLLFPQVTLVDGRTLIRPTIASLADELGITETPNTKTIYDVTVVGAGPSGLAAAVYAASEGLSTLLIEGIAPGGQAGTSSKIENYLGFPTGISGQRLANRAHMQALKFGVQIAISRNVVSLEPEEGDHCLTLAGGTRVHTRAVVVATGAQYRKLDLENYARFENRGIYYAATAMEGVLCKDKEAIVVGGGNSAGQAAIFLSQIAVHVHLIARGASLGSTMSDYLISRIRHSARITIYEDSEIVQLEGEDKLEQVTWKNRKSGEVTARPIGNVFVMVGAYPNSGWLFGSVKLDAKGFVLAGGVTSFENTPYATTVPGIYAVGDVRADSVKRVASAVGEGSVVISYVHRYLSGRTDLAGSSISVSANAPFVTAIPTAPEMPCKVNATTAP